jgi:hypothetical protein
MTSRDETLLRKIIREEIALDRLNRKIVRARHFWTRFIDWMVRS